MALTRNFRDTVKARADQDAAFRAGLYQEALQAVVEGDFATARVLLRDVINATLGFPALAQQAGMSDKSLMRMFSPAGNPTMANLSTVLHALNTASGLAPQVNATPAKPRRRAPHRIAA